METVKAEGSVEPPVGEDCRCGTYPDGLVETSTDHVHLVKLDRGHRPSVADQRPVGLASSH